MTSLFLNNNSISSIDLSTNVNLTSISIGTNALTTLNISNVSSITYLNLTNGTGFSGWTDTNPTTNQISCIQMSQAQLNAVNANGFTGIFDVSVVSLDCGTSFSLDVTASNSSDYTLSGTDRNGNISGSDPNLTFSVGDTISFVVNASGHPFYLKTVAGTGTGNTISGVTNNGVEEGTVTWIPTESGTYYYQCSLHGGMVGAIIIQ